MISGGEPGHARTDLTDNPRSLVAAHHGQRALAHAFEHRKIGVAQACASDFDKHFAGPRTFELDLLDHKRLALSKWQRQALLIHHRGGHPHVVLSLIKCSRSAQRLTVRH
jgi:hypothetical protein